MADLITMLSAVAGQQGEEADEDFNQTVLLLHGDGTNGAQNNTFLDSSTNNFTITRNGNTTQGTFSPFSLSGGYWSNYLDGTDDYLSVADNAVLRPGAGAFTLEAWIYRNASGAAHTVYAKGGASTGIVLQVTSGNVLRFTHTTTNIDSTGTVAANAWVHVAVVREGTGTNQTKLYINGVQDGQGTVSTDFTQTEEVRIGTNRGATDDFAGYISNVRFVKGSALYTAGFTPSTSPLTTTSQGAVSSEVELLTCQSNRFVDNSTNAFTITRNGDVRVTPFSPFAPTAAYSAGTNGGSGYFDGSGDYLTVADNAALDVGTGDFQISFWVYPTAFAGSTNANTIFFKSTNNIVVDFNNSGTINVAQYGVAVRVSSSVNITLNQWAYIVVSRVSSTTKIFLNGAEVGSASDTSNYDSATAAIIGLDTNNTNQRLTGYLADFRLVKGSGVTSVTVPTTPLTAITNTSLLLNFTNAGIIDNTGKNNLETVGNAQIDTTTKKYGTGSLEFDGTGDGLAQYANLENYILGTGNFTIEFWINFTSLSGTPSIFDMRPVATNGAYPHMYVDTSKLRVYVNTANLISGNTTLSTGTWYHVAWVRSSGSSTLYLNGTADASSVSDTTNYLCSRFVVGIDRGLSANPLNGYIDDLRITKGVARYTANFTPPTAAFPDQ